MYRCKACAFVCPTHCIEIVRDGDWLKIPRFGVELEMAHCSVCGKPFATKRELEYDAERLGWSHEYMSKCPECRKQRSAAALASEAVVAAARD